MSSPTQLTFDDQSYYSNVMNGNAPGNALIGVNLNNNNVNMNGVNVNIGAMSLNGYGQSLQPMQTQANGINQPGNNNNQILNGIEGNQPFVEQPRNQSVSEQRISNQPLNRATFNDDFDFSLHQFDEYQRPDDLTRHNSFHGGYNGYQGYGGMGHSKSGQDLSSLQKKPTLQSSRSAYNLRGELRGVNTDLRIQDDFHESPNIHTSVSNHDIQSSIYLMDLMPALSSSVSNQLLSDSPMLFSRPPQATPRRVLRKKSLSVSSMQTPYTPLKGQVSPISLATACAKVSKTPHLKLKGHTRSRSRLSVENGITSSNSFLNNPFYTPSTFISPKIDQISTDLDDLETPLPTPNSRLSEKESPYSPSSPNMRANPYLDSLINQENDAFKELKKAKSYSNIRREDEKLDLSKSFVDRIDLLLPQFTGQYTSAQTSIQTTHGNNQNGQNMNQNDIQNGINSHSFTKSFPASVDLASIASPGLLPPMATFSVQYDEAPTVPTSSLVQLNLMSKIDIPIVKNNRGDKNDRLDPKKKHKCPICDLRFQRPEHVKRHMKSHLLEKPFVCDVGECGKRFNRKDNLKAHLKKIHGRVL